LSRRARLCRSVCCAIVLAAAESACGKGISVDPTSSASNGGKFDAGDAAELTPPEPDASLEDAEQEADAPALDVSMPMLDAADEPANGVDAALDNTQDDARVATIDRHDDVSADAMDEGGDAGDDVRDGAADGIADANDGDGCTLGCGWPEADYYVDWRAPDGGDGSRQKPFKTVTAATLAYASAQGQPKKAYVAAGTYDKALGEQFPLVLRGLSLEGAVRDQTVIVGTGAFNHAGAGGPMHGDYMVTIVAGDRVLTTKISGVLVRPESPVPVQNHIGVFCDRGSATGDVAPPAGQTQIDAATIGPGYHSTVVATTSTTGSVTGCSLSIRASTLTGGWEGVRAIGYQDWPAFGLVALEMGGSDPASGNTISWMQGPTATPGGALLLGGVSASFQYNTFIDSWYGIYVVDPSYALDAELYHFTLKHNSFERLARGAYFAGPVRVDELSDNRFIGITRAPSEDPSNQAFALAFASYILQAQLGKVRRNQFIGNDGGISFVASYRTGSLPTDFGTAGDPGGNVFRCNSALQGVGVDIYVYGADGTSALSMVGNAWDHAPATVCAETILNGCDLGTRSLSGVTLDLSGATIATAACPPDRVPGQ
jgi:hypothetical protein